MSRSEGGAPHGRRRGQFRCGGNSPPSEVSKDTFLREIETAFDRPTFGSELQRAFPLNDVPGIIIHTSAIAHCGNGEGCDD